MFLSLPELLRRLVSERGELVEEVNGLKETLRVTQISYLAPSQKYWLLTEARQLCMLLLSNLRCSRNVLLLLANEQDHTVKGHAYREKSLFY